MSFLIKNRDRFTKIGFYIILFCREMTNSLKEKQTK